MKRVSLFVLFLCALVAAQVPGKPLAGYNVITVQKFEVGSLAENSGYPAGFEGILQKTVYSKLISSRMFTTVVDGSDSGAPTGESADAKKVILVGTIIGYDKGSRTARWMVGMGAGKSKVKVRFVCTDAATGQELWRTDQEGSFSGTFDIGGGNESRAASESTRKVADGLLKQLALVR